MPCIIVGSVVLVDPRTLLLGGEGRGADACTPLRLAKLPRSYCRRDLIIGVIPECISIRNYSPSLVELKGIAAPSLVELKGIPAPPL